MPLSRRSLLLGSLPLMMAAGTVSSSAFAANPVLRHQADLHGDVVVFGSTLGYDCGASTTVMDGASCAGQLNTSDTAPDLYWRDGIANATITATQARTSATLSLPAGATVRYARLYWSALADRADADTTATLDFLGGPVLNVTADVNWVQTYGFASHPTWNYYQASADVTDYIRQYGAGDFRVTDVDALPLAGVTVDRAFSAWTIVVFYENPTENLRNLALFDGFTPIDPGLMEGTASVTLSGFLVPPGFKARMTAFAYEGDNGITGDHFTVNGHPISNAENPVDDFFNSSRSYLGASVSGAADVPKLSGDPGSMAGYDLDTADVTSFLASGDKSATVGADSTLDIFFLGGFVTSVDNLAPDFGSFTKTALDLNGGALLPNDIVQYTITGKNGGNDAATNAVITDVLQAGVELVPGTLEIVTGGVNGVKTDAADTDQAEYNSSTRTITFRVGTGATNTKGGSVAVGASVSVRFNVKVTATSGSVANQAVLAATGASGAGQKTYTTDGDPMTPGDQGTVIVINECQTDAQCSGTKPHCDTTTHVCEACATDADCSDPASPACQPSGACGQCSASNDTLCSGATPICNTDAGICVLCTLGDMGNATVCASDPNGPDCVAGTGTSVHCGCFTDADCGSATSGKICDSTASVCVAGCRGAGGNGCPTGEVCSSTDTSVGTCSNAPATTSSTGTNASGSGGNGGAGASGSGGSTSSHGSGNGDGASGPSAGDAGSCACDVPGGSNGSGSSTISALAAVALLGGLAKRRRRG